MKQIFSLIHSPLRLHCVHVGELRLRWYSCTRTPHNHIVQQREIYIFNRNLLYRFGRSLSNYILLSQTQVSFVRFFFTSTAANIEYTHIRVAWPFPECSARCIVWLCSDLFCVYALPLTLFYFITQWTMKRIFSLRQRLVTMCERRLIWKLRWPDRFNRCAALYENNIALSLLEKQLMHAAENNAEFTFFTFFYVLT